jgi:DNA-binding XRE family transcriptional regulator
VSTRQDTPPIGRLLREKRGEGFKSEAANALGVSRQSYDTWETGHHIPGDEWAETLADYLDLELRDVVWFLYQDRMRGGPTPNGVSPLDAPLGRQSVDYGTTVIQDSRPTDNRPPTHKAA